MGLSHRIMAVWASSRNTCLVRGVVEYFLPTLPTFVGTQNVRLDVMGVSKHCVMLDVLAVLFSLVVYGCGCPIG